MASASPTNCQAFPAGTTSVNLGANASNPGGALVSSDTASPYSFNATGLAAGSHTVAATAFDNGNPMLSTATAALPFTIGATGAVFRVSPAGRRPDQQ